MRHAPSAWDGSDGLRCRDIATYYFEGYATLRPATALPEVLAYGSTANSLPVSESRRVRSGLPKLTTRREMGSLVGVTVDKHLTAYASDPSNGAGLARPL